MKCAKRLTHSGIQELMRVMRVNQESRNRHPEEFRGTLVIIYQATTTVNSVARIGSGSVEIRAGDMALDRPATGELPSGNIHRHPQPTVGPSHQNSTYVSFPSSPGDTSPSVRDPWVHLLADHRQAGVWPARPAPCRRSVEAWILLAGPKGGAGPLPLQQTWHKKCVEGPWLLARRLGSYPRRGDGRIHQAARQSSQTAVAGRQ